MTNTDLDLKNEYIAENDILLDVNNLYSTLSSIKLSIESRFNNLELKRIVEEFWGEDKPAFITDKPFVVISRTVTTPNKELLYFLDIADELGLQPIFLEYRSKFVAKNIDKYTLCKLPFHKGFGKNNGEKIESIRVVDFNINEGKHFDDVTTLWGQGIIDFHHELLFKFIPTLKKDSLVEFTDWFNKTRYLNKDYYFYFLSLFICHGVLLDNFLSDDKEELPFIKLKVIPSFKNVSEYFGVKPLIFPLLPVENQKHIHWLSYPHSLLEDVKNKLK